MKAKTMFELSEELETYKRGFMDQTRLIQKLEKENMDLKEELKRRENKRFEPYKNSLGEFGQGED